jgi:outer membrane protein OmpA-like peptidoglycan-associated protein
MKLHVILIYIASFLLLASCGSTAGTTASNETASTDSRASDDDYDGVPNDVDKCPYIYGTARTFGCPDADGDGLQDSEDRCPDEKGYANLMGCLDRDYDGVIDPDDKCPEEYGEGLAGCPSGELDDLDGDGVKNEQDDCPAVRGMFTARGCPDGDGDGLKDELDACPDLFGIGDHHGCPLSIADMEQIEKVNGNPNKSDGIAEKGYYKKWDGKLYDRNDMRIDIADGDIVDQGGIFITISKEYIIDRQGYIRNASSSIVRVDEEGYAFDAEGLLSKKQINADGVSGGIEIGPHGIDFKHKGTTTLSGPRSNNNDTNNSSNTDNVGNDNLNANIYKNKGRNEAPLTEAETADCNRISLATLTAAIYFDYDASRAEGSSLRQLNRVVDAMQKCTKLELQVGGYADSDGGDNYNYKLSEKRAKSVLSYIMGQGISDRRLKYNAYGEKYPLSSNSTNDGKQLNRRAEINVSRSSR